MLYNPLISIVTVSYQAENTIEKTIKSVLNQSYHNIEYVFKDGESTDNTNIIIEEYKKNFNNRDIKVKHIICEDHGIYSAMNQSLEYCTGEYILFLNADDTLYSNDILEEIFGMDIDLDRADIIYGDTDFVDEKMHFLWKGNIDVVKKKCPFCHQSSFVKRSWMLQHPFDETLKITADYDFIFKSYMENARFVYVEKIIAQFNRGGMSGTHLVEDRKEARKVQLRYNLEAHSYGYNLRYGIRLISAFVQEKVFMYIPHGITTQMRHFSKKRKMKVIATEPIVRDEILNLKKVRGGGWRQASDTYKQWTEGIGDNNEIEIRISGGIGNQLFQYAFGYSLYKRYNQKVIFDNTYFEYDTSRVYGLDKFNLEISENISYMRDIKDGGIKRYLQIVIAIMKKRKRLSNFIVVKEGGKKSFDRLKEGNYYFIGFWQNEKYFKQYRNELSKQFVLQAVSKEYQLWLEKIKRSKNVSVHIRRTDYIQYQALIDPDYYLAAIKKIQALTDIDFFYIFTDDPNWVIKYFQDFEFPISFEIISGNDHLSDLEELMLMKECQHHIVANSSFSWWGGWLGEYEKKIVIAPKVNIWNEEFYPKEWILIDANIKTKEVKENLRKMKVKDRLVSMVKEVGYL